MNLIIHESYFLDIEELLKNVDVSVQDKALVENPAAFVGGYLARFVLKDKRSVGMNCQTCQNLLTQAKQLTTQTVFLEFKSFNFVKLGLVYPSDPFIQTVVEFGNAFASLYENFATKPGLKQRIVANLLNIDNSWFNCSEHYHSGWLQMVQFYAKMMLYNKVKYVSHKLSMAKKYNRKIKKLQ